MARSKQPIARLLASLALFAVFTGHAASAADPSEREILTLDSTQSRAEFSIRVMWLIPVHGRFGTLHGTITIDRFHGTASVDARIDVEDVHMRSHSDETWVKSPEFFDTANYPQITFLSDSFSLSRLVKGGEIEGVLTIRGIAQRARFNINPTECPDAIARACPAEAEGAIRRSDFGMRSHRGALSDKVELNFSIRVLPATVPAQ
jgi:polyisoprenoid-binding protein YceI